MNRALTKVASSSTKSSISHSFVAISLLAFAAQSGCTQVSGRKKLQDGNKLYKDGDYKGAVALFEEAEKLVPELPVLWLNKGFSCRQMLIPGSKTPENLAAGKCAQDSFKRLMELAPNDSRGEALYIQTLFDIDDFPTLSKLFESRVNKNPKDLESITGLIQVYTKWNKVEEALSWYQRKAEVQGNNAEAKYSVGVFIWQELARKGGGQDKAMFDPRPNPDNPSEKKVPPPAGIGDIVSAQRVDMADQGAKYLEEAVALKPKYHEAMTYLGLLYRQKSFALFETPDDWQKCIDASELWGCKSVETQGRTPPQKCEPIFKRDANAVLEAARKAGHEEENAPAAGNPADKAAASKATSKGKNKSAPRKGKRGGRG